MKIIKVKVHMDWKYAETTPSEDVLEIEMTEEDYNNEKQRNDIIQTEYEEWLWNEIGDYTYWEEVE